MENENFQDLMAQVRACTFCDDLELGPKPIFQLNKHVQILIVGQAPGRLTHAKNRPFDDPPATDFEIGSGWTDRVFTAIPDSEFSQWGYVSQAAVKAATRRRDQNALHCGAPASWPI